MKFLIVSLLIASVALISADKADWMEQIKALSQTCREESHATEEDLQKFYKNGMKAEDASDAIKCHIKCMMEQRGILKNGEFDVEAIVEGVKKVPLLKDHVDDIAKVAGECKAQKGDNECDTAYKFAMCFKENKEALGIPIFKKNDN